MAITKSLKKINGRPVGGATRGLPFSRFEPLEARLVFSTYTVSNLFDSGAGSLRAAIDAANAAAGADEVTFAGGLAGTISLTSELSVTDDLMLSGSGEKKLRISGGDVTRVLSVSGADTELAISKLTIADGLASVPTGMALGGGLLNQGASVSVDHVSFEDNRAVGQIAAGGAVANIGGQFECSHTSFSSNSVQCADGRDCFGGAVFNDTGAVVDMDHTTFSANTSLGGGANGGAVGVVDGSQASFDHCSFDSNQALGAPTQYGGGGAVVIQSTGLSGSSGPIVSISHCDFTNNRAAIRGSGVAGSDARGQGFGGAVIVEFGTTPPTPTPPVPVLTIEYSSFDGNSVEGRSGGTGNPGAVGRLGGAAWGGAIHNVSSTLVLRHDSFTNNRAKGGDGGEGGNGANGGAGNFAIGGAVVSGTLSPGVTPPTTTIENCEFTNNRAIGGNGGPGGAGGNGGAANRGDGGGLAILNGITTIDNSSIVGNTSVGGDGGAAGSGAGTKGGDGGVTRGGGFAHEKGSITTVTSTVICGNQALGGAGGAGRNGGDAHGGGIFNGRPAEQAPDPTLPTNLTLIDCEILDNSATGGSGGAGGKGGNALGGGIVNINPIPVAGTPILTLLGTFVSGNSVFAGAGGTGGANGVGVGGGLYNQSGGLASADALTIISGNHASTSDDDIFGTLTSI